MADNSTSNSSFSLVEFLRQAALSEYFILYLAVIYFLIFIPVVPEIVSGGNISNLLSNIWPLYAIAIGQTVALITGCIDLSQISVISLTSVVTASFVCNAGDPNVLAKSPLWGWMLTEQGSAFINSGWALPLGILAGLLVGIIIGLINGVSVAKLGMPPFMVTLVTQMFFGAFAIFLTKSENIRGLLESYTAIGHSSIGILSVTALITVVLALFTHFMLTRTVLGDWLFSTGMNIKTSLVSGVPTDKMIIFGYVFSGFCASVGGILYSSRMKLGVPTLGEGMLLDIIAAVVIGGTSLFGGKGKVTWTLFGVLFLKFINNSLSLLGLPYFTINIVMGGIILFAATLDVWRSRVRLKENE